MMKMFPKGYCEESVAYRRGQLIDVPQWVSGMGLEWLYEIVLRFEELLRTKAPRQG